MKIDYNLNNQTEKEKLVYINTLIASKKGSSKTLLNKLEKQKTKLDLEIKEVKSDLIQIEELKKEKERLTKSIKDKKAKLAEVKK